MGVNLAVSLQQRTTRIGPRRVLSTLIWGNPPTHPIQLSSAQKGGARNATPQMMQQALSSRQRFRLVRLARNEWPQFSNAESVLKLPTPLASFGGQQAFNLPSSSSFFSRFIGGDALLNATTLYIHSRRLNCFPVASRCPLPLPSGARSSRRHLPRRHGRPTQQDRFGSSRARPRWSARWRVEAVIPVIQEEVPEVAPQVRPERPGE